jgi:hypothetical protein
MLGIRSARAISADELLFEYDVAGVTAALTLLLENGVLRDAKLVYDGPGVTDAQLNEVVENAVDANDAPGLIADVLVRLRAF